MRLGQRHLHIGQRGMETPGTNLLGSPEYGSLLFGVTGWLLVLCVVAAISIQVVASWNVDPLRSVRSRLALFRGFYLSAMIPGSELRAIRPGMKPVIVTHGSEYDDRFSAVPVVHLLWWRRRCEINSENEEGICSGDRSREIGFSLPPDVTSAESTAIHAIIFAKRRSFSILTKYNMSEDQAVNRWASSRAAS